MTSFFSALTFLQSDQIIRRGQRQKFVVNFRVGAEFIFISFPLLRLLLSSNFFFFLHSLSLTQMCKPAEMYQKKKLPSFKVGKTFFIILLPKKVKSVTGDAKIN